MEDWFAEWLVRWCESWAARYSRFTLQAIRMDRDVSTLLSTPIPLPHASVQ